jgi:hypothetical protein
MSMAHAETTEQHLAIRSSMTVIDRFERKVTARAARTAMTQTIEGSERATLRSNENRAIVSFEWIRLRMVRQMKYHGGRVTVKTDQRYWSETNRIVRRLKESFYPVTSSETDPGDPTTRTTVKGRSTGPQNSDPDCSSTTRGSDRLGRERYRFGRRRPTTDHVDYLRAL